MNKAKSTFSKRERILRTINREPIDCLPVNLEFSPHLAKAYAKYKGIKEEDLIELLGNHIIYLYLSDEVDRKDGLVIDNWGVGYEELEGASIKVCPLSNKEMIKKYVFPDPSEKYLMDGPKENIKKYKSNYFIASYQRWLLFERACWLRGAENFMIDMVSDIVFAEWLLDKIMEYQIMIAHRYVDLGVDCGRTGDDWGSQRGMMFSPELWRKLIKPRLSKIWEVYHQAGLPVIHHTCGDVRPIIPDLIDLKLDILHPIQDVMPREELKEKYGSEIVFYGGIDTQKVLPLGTPEEVYQDVSECIKTLGKGGGYIVGLGHTLTSETPFSNIDALLLSVVKDNI